jgi:hypothetical protein
MNIAILIQQARNNTQSKIIKEKIISPITPSSVISLMILKQLAYNKVITRKEIIDAISKDLSVSKITVHYHISKLISQQLLTASISYPNVLESRISAMSGISDEWKTMTTEEVESKFKIIPQTLELKKGEIKEIEDGMFIKKDNDGILTVYSVKE